MPEYYVELIEVILSQYPETLVLLTGSSSERDEIAQIRDRVDHPRCYNTAGRFALEQLPLLYSNSHLMVTNDSGPGHFVETHPHDPETERTQIQRLRRVREQRDEVQVQQLLEKLRTVGGDESQNLMPVTIELVKAGASMGDIVESLREMWGTYRETAVI